MAMAVLSYSQHHQPLRHSPSLPSRFRRIDQRPRGLAYPLDTRLKLSRPSPFLVFDERLRTLIERCHLSLRLSSSSLCLKHDQTGETGIRSAIRAHAKSSANRDTDAETAEWIRHALHDPMVEVDPVTICHQISAEKQSRPLEVSTTLVDSSPPAFQQRLLRLNKIAVASVIAVFLLAVVGILQYLGFRKTGERRKLKKGATLSTNTLEPSNAEMDSLKETIGESHDALTGISAAMVGKVAVEGDRFVRKVENLQSDFEAGHAQITSTQDETEQNVTLTDVKESLGTKRNDGSYSQDLTDQMNLSEGWNTNDGNGSSQGALDKTESDGLMEQSRSTKDLASAILAQNLSELSDTKVFTEHTPQTGFSEEMKVIEKQRVGRGSSYWNEGDYTMDQSLSSSESDQADSAQTIYTSQVQIQNGGILITDPLSLEGKPPADLHSEGSDPSFWSSSTAASSHPGKHHTHGSSPYELQISSSVFQPQPDDLRVLDPPESELPPFEFSETLIDKASEQDRETYTKALEQALPALFVAVGTAGTLWGVAGGLKVVGFAAAVQLISQDLFWAESREAFWQQLRSITDRQKLRDFLSKRNVVKDD